MTPFEDTLGKNGSSEPAATTNTIVESATLLVEGETTLDHEGSSDKNLLAVGDQGVGLPDGIFKPIADSRGGFKCDAGRIGSSLGHLGPSAKASSNDQYPNYLPYLEDGGPSEGNPMPLMEPNTTPESVTEATTMPGAYAEGEQGQEDHLGIPINDTESHTGNLPTMEGTNMVEALRVDEEYSPANRMEAEPLDEDHLAQRVAKEKRERIFQRVVCGFTVIAILVLTLSLGLGLSNSKPQIQKSEVVLPNHKDSLPTTETLVMEGMERMFNDLPERTKESLNDKASPQFIAWEWLLNYPNISSLEEWRKKQLYAMATFFHSFEGPNWPDNIRSKWMDTNTNECMWGLSGDELGSVAEDIISFLGSAYGQEDYQACNAEGEIQTLLMHQLYLPTSAKPSMPPEVALLTSLRILVINSSQIRAKVSDLLVPELIQMPTLVQLNLGDSGLTGTIPKEISLMTSLRHLSFFANELTGSIPSEIAKLASLELISLSGMDGLRGKVPTELALMKNLSCLDASMCSLEGSIPSELGLLSKLTWLQLWKNLLTGPIPSEMGLLAGSSLGTLDQSLSIAISRNALTGAIPTELGMMTRLTWLSLHMNRLTSSVPTDLGLMLSIKQLSLRDNALTGPIPSELGLLSDVIGLRLGNESPEQPYKNNFTGTIPAELWELNALHRLSLNNLPFLSGTIPDDLCYLEGNTSCGREPNVFVYGENNDCVLEFDCTELLCGCNCNCFGSANDSGLALEKRSLP